MAECEYTDWHAVLDSMPPGQPTLRVTATGKCPRAGCEAKLVKKEPQGTNPADLLLELEETCEGDVGASVMTDIEVRYEEDAEPGQFTTVTILPEGETVEVQEVS
jgi:hypothetical protein